MSPACLTVPAGGDDYWSGTVVWHNVMLTVRPCDALSSFARPGSSERSRRLVPGRRGPPLRIYRWEKTTAVAVKIKLKRLGKIREPYYRIVVADSRTKRDGRAIEEIGKYHPKAEPSLIEVNSERVQHWLSVGAQPTDPVRVLLKITGDWQKFRGEPGSEGTLRIAKPREDKRGAFEAAAKASAATKEKDDKASSSAKVGSRTAKPAREGAAQGTRAKAAPAKADSAPTVSAPAASAPAEAPAESPPAEAPAAAVTAEAPAASALAEAPAASAPAEAPADSAPAEAAAASAPAEAVTAEAPADSASAEAPADSAPAEAVTAEAPADSAPADSAPEGSAAEEDAASASSTEA
jgi:small subunit ribosomal protein S16